MGLYTCSAFSRICFFCFLGDSFPPISSWSLGLALSLDPEEKPLMSSILVTLQDIGLDITGAFMIDAII